MIKILFITFLILIGTLISRAQLALNNAPFAALLNRNATAGLYFEEDFEAPGYENPWVEDGSGGVITPNSAAAPAPLLGSFSLRMVLTADTARTRVNVGTHGTVYGFCMLNFNTLPPPGESFIGFSLSPGVDVVNLELIAGNQLRFAGSATTTDPILAATTYFVWWTYIKGTGANATYEIAFSTTPTKPTSGNTYALITNGAATSDVDLMRFGAEGGSPVTWLGTFDHIILSTSPIGSNP